MALALAAEPAGAVSAAAAHATLDAEFNSQGCCVVVDGETDGMEFASGARPRTRVSRRTVGGERASTNVDDAGRPGGRCHSRQLWRRSSDLKTAADRYVVTPNNVSIDADGLVAVSVEPVVVSVPALP